MTDAPRARPIPPPRPDNAGSWSADVVLADGGTVHVRPITVADADELVAFHERQSRDSIYYRYFSAKARLTPAELDRFTHVDMYDRAGLVAEEGDRMIAWASYDRWPGRRDADVAFLVDDGHHGRGIATILFEHLVAIARTNGMERFTAEVLADNRGMLTVFRKAGWPLTRELESGVVEISFDLDTTDQVVETIERREQRADSRAVARLLYPRSIAVIGASEQPGSAGRAIFENLRRSYGGSLYPVNPNRASVGGIAAYPSIEAVPGLVHLAIVAVPQDELEPVLRACATHRVRGAIVITTAPPGLDVPELVAHCRRFGMRMIGPGSLGVLVAKPDVAMQATLVPGTLPEGGVGFSLQSGSLGSSILDRVQTLGMGVSTFVSLGDKADISGNDLLQFFDDDAPTRVIGMYTESFGNARKFARITRRLAASKPIVAVRVRADGEGSGLDAMYQDAGVIRVDTVPDMLDTVRVLASQPLPAGDRVAIVSNSRSPLVLAKQAAEANGLLVVAEPVLAWNASPEQFAEELANVLALEQVDSALVIHAPPVASAVDVPAQAIDNAARDSAKPVVAVLLGRPDGPLTAGSAVPAFEFPEQAVAVLGRAARLSSWREQEAADARDGSASADGRDVIERVAHAPLDPPIDHSAARQAIEAALAAHPDGTLLASRGVGELLRAYGVPVARTIAVTSLESALSAADQVGYPVALKATGVRRFGRSAAAGVALDLHDGESLSRAYRMMESRPDTAVTEAIVQQMVEPGADLRVALVLDAALGPVLTFGLGGVHAEAIGDQVAKLPPFGRAGARAMVQRTRAAGALAEAGADVDAVIDLLVRVARLADEHPEIDRLDLNPILAGSGGVCVTDASVHVRRVDAVEMPLRRL